MLCALYWKSTPCFQMKSYFKISICVAEEHSTSAAAEVGDSPTPSPGANCHGWLGMGMDRNDFETCFEGIWSSTTSLADSEAGCRRDHRASRSQSVALIPLSRCCRLFLPTIGQNTASRSPLPSAGLWSKHLTLAKVSEVLLDSSAPPTPAPTPKWLLRPSVPSILKCLSDQSLALHTHSGFPNQALTFHPNECRSFLTEIPPTLVSPLCQLSFTGSLISFL